MSCPRRSELVRAMRAEAVDVLHQQLVVFPLMGARLVVVTQKGIQEGVEVLSSEDNEVVEHLIAQGPNKPLDVGLHPMGPKCYLDDLSPLAAEGLIHCPAEFRVPIVDNVPDGQSAPAGLSYQGFGLGHDPGFVGMFGGRGDDGAPGVNMQKRNHEYFADPFQGQHFLAEKVHLPERRGVTLQELVPRSTLPHGTGREPVRREDILNVRFADDDSEFCKFSGNAAAAPSILAGQFEDQPRISADVMGRPRFRLGPFLRLRLASRIQRRKVLGATIVTSW